MVDRMAGHSDLSKVPLLVGLKVSPMAVLMVSLMAERRDVRKAVLTVVWKVVH